MLLKERSPKTSDDDALSLVKKTISESVSVIKKSLHDAEVSDDFLVINLNKHKKKVESIYGLSKKIEPDRISFE
jgi:hypothetical protein